MSASGCATDARKKCQWRGVEHRRGWCAYPQRWSHFRLRPQRRPRSAEDDREHEPRPPAGKIDEVDAAKEAAMTVAELCKQSKASKTYAAFHHILVATDFSEPSRRALCDALVLATENDAQLSLVHVLHFDRN